MLPKLRHAQIWAVCWNTDLDIRYPGWGLRFCISNKLPSDAEAAGLSSHSQALGSQAVLDSGIRMWAVCWKAWRSPGQTFLLLDLVPASVLCHWQDPVWSWSGLSSHPSHPVSSQYPRLEIPFPLVILVSEGCEPKILYDMVSEPQFPSYKSFSSYKLPYSFPSYIFLVRRYS